MAPEPEFSVPAESEANAQQSPGVVDNIAVARLYGEPLFSMPTDLTSRPMRYSCSSKPSRARSTCCCT